MKTKINSWILFLSAVILYSFDKRFASGFTISNKFPFNSFLGGIEYFRTGRGNRGLRIDDFMYKRHYETSNSVYWICTLANKWKCKQRVIAEKRKPFSIRFKGPGHNHSLLDYHTSTAYASIANSGPQVKVDLLYSDNEWKYLLIWIIKCYVHFLVENWKSRIVWDYFLSRTFLLITNGTLLFFLLQTSFGEIKNLM